MSKRNRDLSRTGLTPESKESKNDGVGGLDRGGENDGIGGLGSEGINDDSVVSLDKISEDDGIAGLYKEIGNGGIEGPGKEESLDEVIADLEQHLDRQNESFISARRKVTVPRMTGKEKPKKHAMDTSGPGPSSGTIITPTGATVTAVGKPPRKKKMPTAEKEPTLDDRKKARSSIEVRVFLFENGLTKSMTGEEWDIVSKEFAALMLDPRYGGVQKEVSLREKTIMNTSGNKAYGVIGAKTKEGAAAIVELLHGIEFEELQISAKVNTDKADTPVRVEMLVSSKGILDLADKIADNLCRLNDLPGCVLGHNVVGRKLEIYPDEELQKALETKENMALSIGTLECKYKFVRNNKK